jgi:hypothetical protein
MLRRCQSKVLLPVGLTAAVAMMAAMFGVATAQAHNGPVWIHGAAPGKVLLAGEKLTVDLESEGEVTLKSSLTNIICKSVQGKGELVGGEPGTNLEELEFLECKANSKTVTECAASSGSELGVILTNVLTALAYPLEKVGGNEAYDGVFPDGSVELFVEITFEGTKCELIPNKTKITILAEGTLIHEVKGALFEANCGELGILGILNSGGTFEPTGSGVLVEDGVVNFPSTKISSAELYSNIAPGGPLEYRPITCKLGVDDGATKVAGAEEGIVLAEVLNGSVKEPFGWEK